MYEGTFFPFIIIFPDTSIFNKTMLSLLLLKLNILMKPKEELFKKEQDGDSWFEFLKHLQQYPCKYPEDQKFIPGTFFLDWSLSEDIGLYFSIFNGKETQFDDNFNSALWIFDAGSVGKIQQISKTSKIIDLMCSQKFRNGDEGFPLLFYPEKQITNNIKIKNQLI